MDRERQEVADEVMDLVLTAAAWDQDMHGGSVDPQRVARMTLAELVQVIGHTSTTKCEGYAKSVMDMTLSFAKSVAEAGGGVGTWHKRPFNEMVAQLSHNGIRFHYEKTPERIRREANEAHPHPFDPEHVDHSSNQRLDGHNA
jgi:hypothetical protein